MRARAGRLDRGARGRETSQKEAGRLRPAGAEGKGGWGWGPGRRPGRKGGGKVQRERSKTAECARVQRGVSREGPLGRGSADRERGKGGPRRGVEAFCTGTRRAVRYGPRTNNRDQNRKGKRW